MQQYIGGGLDAVPESDARLWRRIFFLPMTALISSAPASRMRLQPLGCVYIRHQMQPR